MNHTENKNKNREMIRKYLIYAGMGILFLGALLLIFAPSAEEKEKEAQSAGFNMDVPGPSNVDIVPDKQTAYQQEMMQEKKKERMKTLDDFLNIVGNDQKDESDNEVAEGNKTATRTYSPGYPSGKGRGNNATNINGSTGAYREANRSLSAFYGPSGENEEVRALEEELKRLKEERDNPSPSGSVEEQLYLMEKSYEIASRYMPQNQTGAPSNAHIVSSPALPDSGFPDKVTHTGNDKSTARNNQSDRIQNAGIARSMLVSSLSRPIPDIEFIGEYSKERNIGFHTIGEASESIPGNTIKACIHEDQTLTGGMEAAGGQRTVKIRLEEDIAIGNCVVPRHTILTGKAKIGERLDIVISSVEFSGSIFHTGISVYDMDGQPGLYIPGSLEINALKEVAANAGSSMGTSINVTSNAGQQVAADLSRGVMQGTSQYLSKKMRQVKVHLKAGYKVLLLAKEEQKQ